MQKNQSPIAKSFDALSAEALREQTMDKVRQYFKNINDPFVSTTLMSNQVGLAHTKFLEIVKLLAKKQNVAPRPQSLVLAYWKEQNDPRLSDRFTKAALEKGLEQEKARIFFKIAQQYYANEKALAEEVGIPASMVLYHMHQMIGKDPRAERGKQTSFVEMQQQLLLAMHLPAPPPSIDLLSAPKKLALAAVEVPLVNKKARVAKSRAGADDIFLSKLLGHLSGSESPFVNISDLKKELGVSCYTIASRLKHYSEENKIKNSLSAVIHHVWQKDKNPKLDDKITVLALQEELSKGEAEVLRFLITEPLNKDAAAGDEKISSDKFNLIMSRLYARYQVQVQHGRNVRPANKQQLLEKLGLQQLVPLKATPETNPILLDTAVGLPVPQVERPAQETSRSVELAEVLPLTLPPPENLEPVVQEKPVKHTTKPIAKVVGFTIPENISDSEAMKIAILHTHAHFDLDGMQHMTKLLQKTKSSWKLGKTFVEIGRLRKQYGVTSSVELFRKLRKEQMLSSSSAEVSA